MRNYRNHKYTTRTGKITQTQINRLRSTQLKKATSYKQIKYLSSKSFDKTIRNNIRNNRVKKNVKNLTAISKKLNLSNDNSNVISQLFGEKTRIYNGKKIKINSFTSEKQTKKLSKIVAKINSGKFNIKKYISNNKKYKSVKNFLPSNSSIQDILTSLDRTEFYFENKMLIMKHNKNVDKYGKHKAITMKHGLDLRNKYFENLADEDQEFLIALGVLK